MPPPEPSSLGNRLLDSQRRLSSVQEQAGQGEVSRLASPPRETSIGERLVQQQRRIAQLQKAAKEREEKSAAEVMKEAAKPIKPGDTPEAVTDKVGNAVSALMEQGGKMFRQLKKLLPERAEKPAEEPAEPVPPAPKPVLQEERPAELPVEKGLPSYAWEYIQSVEGGFSDHPDDRGGATNFGISSRFMSAKHPELSPRQIRKKIKGLSKKEARDIYYNDFWIPSGSAQIYSEARDPSLALVVFDSAVQHGQNTATKLLEKSEGNANSLIEVRREHYKKLKQNNIFGRGWMNRLYKLQKTIDAPAFGKKRAEEGFAFVLHYMAGSQLKLAELRMEEQKNMRKVGKGFVKAMEAAIEDFSKSDLVDAFGQEGYNLIPHFMAGSHALAGNEAQRKAWEAKARNEVDIDTYSEAVAGALPATMAALGIALGAGAAVALLPAAAAAAAAGAIGTVGLAKHYRRMAKLQAKLKKVKDIKGTRKAAKITALVTGPTTFGPFGALQQANIQDRHIQEGGEPPTFTEQQLARWLGAAAETGTEFAPFAMFLRGVPKGSGIAGALNRIAQAGVVEGAQEGLVSVLHEGIAKGVYDANLPEESSVLHDAAVGAGVGVVMRTLIESAFFGTRALRGYGKGETPPKEMQQFLEAWAAKGKEAGYDLTPFILFMRGIPKDSAFAKELARIVKEEPSFLAEYNAVEMFNKAVEALNKEGATNDFDPEIAPDQSLLHQIVFLEGDGALIRDFLERHLLQPQQYDIDTGTEEEQGDEDRERDTDTAGDGREGGEGLEAGAEAGVPEDAGAEDRPDKGSAEPPEPDTGSSVGRSEDDAAEGERDGEADSGEGTLEDDNEGAAEQVETEEEQYTPEEQAEIDELEQELEKVRQENRKLDEEDAKAAEEKPKKPSKPRTTGETKTEKPAAKEKKEKGEPETLEEVEQRMRELAANMGDKGKKLLEEDGLDADDIKPQSGTLQFPKDDNATAGRQRIEQLKLELKAEKDYLDMRKLRKRMLEQQAQEPEPEPEPQPEPKPEPAFAEGEDLLDNDRLNELDKEYGKILRKKSTEEGDAFQARVVEHILAQGDFEERVSQYDDYRLRRDRQRDVLYGTPVDEAFAAEIERRTEKRKEERKEDNLKRGGKAVGTKIFEMSPEAQHFYENATPAERYKRNIEIIELLARRGLWSEFRERYKRAGYIPDISAASRLLPEEMDLLSTYTGWGGLRQFITDNSMNELKEKLVAALNEYETLNEVGLSNEYEPEVEGLISSIRASSVSAHYTSIPVANFMWRAVEKLGFTSGTVLEPSAGTGIFFTMMSQAMKRKTLRIGIEPDFVSWIILHAIHGRQRKRAKIIARTFDDAQGIIGEKPVHLVIANPPFSRRKTEDAKYSLHNHILVESFRKVEPGGLMIAVVTHNFMDSKTNAHRQEIQSMGALVAGFRMPYTAFENNANTEITADILIFRKGMVGQDKSWLDTLEVELPISGTDKSGTGRVNSYFVRNPSHVLGNFAFRRMAQGRLDAAVEPQEGVSMVEALNQALAIVPEQGTAAFNAGVLQSVDPNIPAGMDVAAMTPFSIHEHNGEFWSIELIDAEDGMKMKTARLLDGIDEDQKKKLRGIIKVRDAMLAVIQGRTLPKEEQNELRKELNRVYDEFVSAFGPITLPKSRRLYKDDLTANVLLGLENNVDRKKGTADKSDIFKPIVERKAETGGMTLAEAMAYAHEETGTFDINLIAEGMGVSAEEVFVRAAGRLIYDPLKREWMTMGVFASGNVREKLREVRSLRGEMSSILKDYAFVPEDFAEKALEAAIPKRVFIRDIPKASARGWMPEDFMSRFTTWMLYYDGSSELLKSGKEEGVYARGVGPGSSGGKEYAVTKAHGAWEMGKVIAGEGGVLYINLSPESKNISGREILKAVLNMKFPSRRMRSPDGTTTIVNREAEAKIRSKIAFAQDKLNEFIDHFSEEAEEVYNERMNAHVMPSYNHDVIPAVLQGQNPGIELRDHQRDAIARIIHSQNILIDHQVGLGKTFSIAAGIMERRRMGLTNKPLVIVPNAIYEQWGNHFRELYPSASLFHEDKNKFGGAGLQRQMARMLAGDYDAIIVPYSVFLRMELSAKTNAELLRAEIEEKRQVLHLLKGVIGKGGDVNSQRSLRSIEDSIAKFDEEAKRYEQAVEKGTDQGVSFEDIGIDMMVVDESHNFKRLSTPTALSDVKGPATVIGSKRADSLKRKLDVMRRMHPKSNTIFATGTPMTNSVAELYVIMKYLAQDVLDDINVRAFDAWAHMFTEVTEELWPIIGNKSKIVRTMQITNARSLGVLYNQFSSVASRSDSADSVPKIVTENVVLEMNPTQKLQMIEIQDRWNTVGSKKPEEDNYLLVYTDARKMTLYASLLDPMADPGEVNKVTVAADSIYSIYKKWGKHKGTQLVFISMGVPKKDSVVLETKEDESREKGERLTEDEKETQELDEKLQDMAQDAYVNLYAIMKENLIRRGVKANEIAFLQDFDRQGKVKLQDDINQGKIRVLIGSIRTMGEGLNINKKAVGMHILDLPFRASDLEQATGRVLRQGSSLLKELREAGGLPVNIYLTAGTLEQGVAQLMLQKQKNYEDFRKGLIRQSAHSVDLIESSPLKQAFYSGVLGDTALSPELRRLAELTQEKEDLNSKRHAEESSRIDAQKRYDEAYNKNEFGINQLKKLEHDLTIMNAAVRGKDGGRKAPIFLDELTREEGHAAEHTAKEAAERILKRHAEANLTMTSQKLTVGRFMDMRIELTHDTIELHHDKGGGWEIGKILVSKKGLLGGETSLKVPIKPETLEKTLQTALERLENLRMDKEKQSEKAKKEIGPQKEALDYSTNKIEELDSQLSEVEREVKSLEARMREQNAIDAESGMKKMILPMLQGERGENGWHTVDPTRTVGGMETGEKWIPPITAHEGVVEPQEKAVITDPKEGTREIVVTRENRAPVRLSKVMEVLAKTGVLMRRGKLGPQGRDAAAYYWHDERDDLRIAFIRYRKPSEVEVLIHELGHALQYHRKWGGQFVSFMAKHEKEIVKYSYAANIEKMAFPEGWAETFRLWATNYAMLKKQSPEMVRDLDALIRSLPKTEKKALLEVQEWGHRWYGQGSLKIAQAKSTSEKGTRRKGLAHWRKTFTDGIAFGLGPWERISRQLGYHWLDDNNPYLNASLTHGVPSAAQAHAYELPDGTPGPNTFLPEIFGEQALDAQFMDEWLTYMAARRAKVLLKQGRERLFGAKEIDLVLEKYKDREKFKEAADAWEVFADRLLRWVASMGGLTAAEFAAMKTMNPFYFPFRRAFGDDAYARRDDNRGGTIGRLKGSTLTLDLRVAMGEYIYTMTKIGFVAQADAAMYRAFLERGSVYEGEPPIALLDKQAQVLNVQAESIAERIVQLTRGSVEYTFHTLEYFMEKINDLVGAPLTEKQKGMVAALIEGYEEMNEMMKEELKKNKEKQRKKKPDATGAVPLVVQMPYDRFAGYARKLIRDAATLLLQVQDKNAHGGPLAFFYMMDPQLGSDGAMVRSAVVGGERVFYEVTDQMLYNATRYMQSRPIAHPLVRALIVMPTMLLAGTVVTAPRFLVSALTKDILLANTMMAGIVKPIRSLRVLRHVLPQISQTVGDVLKQYRGKRPSRVMLEIKRSGGWRGGMITNMISDKSGRKLSRSLIRGVRWRYMTEKAADETFGEKITRVTHPTRMRMALSYEGIMHFIEGLEHIVRGAAYRTAREGGYSRKVSAFISRQFFGDYSQHGNNVALSSVLRSMIFANAGAQSLNRLHTLFRNDPKGAMAQMLFSGSVLFINLAFISFLLMRNNKCYHALSPYQKANYLYFSLPCPQDGEDGPTVRLPVPFEIGKAFMTMPFHFFMAMDKGLTAEGWTDEQRLEFEELLMVAIQDSVGGFYRPDQMLGGTVIGPIAQMAMNRTTWGGPINVPFRGVARQRSTTTNEAVIQFAGRVGWSPRTVEHLMSGFLNHWWSAAGGLAKIAVWDEDEWGEMPYKFSFWKWSLDSIVGKGGPSKFAADFFRYWNVRSDLERVVEKTDGMIAYAEEYNKDLPVEITEINDDAKYLLKDLNDFQGDNRENYGNNLILKANEISKTKGLSAREKERQIEEITLLNNGAFADKTKEVLPRIRELEEAFKTALK